MNRQRLEEKTRAVLEDRARRGILISYSKLANILNGELEPDDSPIEPDSWLLKDLLRVMSEEDYDEDETKNKGMLSAIVVYKNDPQIPGPGFFKLARNIGALKGDTAEAEMIFLIAQLNKVYEVHGEKRKKE